MTSVAGLTRQVRGAGGSAVDVRGLTWRPAGRRAPVLRGIDLTLAPGERVLLAGPSGAGKTTLLRSLAGVLGSVEQGDLDGEVTVDGAPAEAGGRAGLLLQEPGDAIVAARVGRDVAFGPENLGLPREQIRARVGAALDAVGFPYPARHLTGALSGGESQRLALAGALALEPGLLLLDEPTSMLDPVAAEQVRAAVLDVVSARGSTLVVVDHRLGPWLDVVDRLVVLSADGEVVADGPTAQVLARHREALGAAGLWLPGLGEPRPLDVPAEVLAPAWEVPAGAPVLHAEQVAVRRGSSGPLADGTPVLALDGVDAAATAGAATALLGVSGAGKSTLVQVLAGLLRPDRGSVTAAAELAARGRRDPVRWRSRELAARLGWVPQQPEHAFVARTVRDEVHATGRVLEGGPALEARADALLEVLGLDRLAGADPHRLSGGEQRRLVVAAALAHGPAAVLLDEPTVGQDRRTWAAVAGVVGAARDAGVGVVMATHDEQFVAAVADRVLRLAAGRVVA